MIMSNPPVYGHHRAAVAAAVAHSAEVQYQIRAPALLLVHLHRRSRGALLLLH